jgi:putative transposase
MSHTCIRLYAHIVFSTKHRQPLLAADLRPRLFAYMGGIFRELGAPALLVNGPADHVHNLICLPAVLSLADIMRVVKSNSSRWVHEQSPRLRGFAWQTGYGAFSVSQSDVDVVREYIANQEAHHRRRGFKEEFLSLLAEYGVEVDETYLWD